MSRCKQHVRTLVRMLVDEGRPADPPLGVTELAARSDSVRPTHACGAAESRVL